MAKKIENKKNKKLPFKTKKKKEESCRPIQKKLNKTKRRYFRVEFGIVCNWVNCLLDISLNVCGFVVSINVCTFGR